MALENPESTEYKPALIHGDLASYHILFDPQAGKITGVIDFGMGVAWP
jgi:aminoglycoside phosphotransferase (APT) family kinase protein